MRCALFCSRTNEYSQAACRHFEQQDKSVGGAWRGTVPCRHAVSKDSDKPVGVVLEESKNGDSVHDVKNWFVNRYLYSAHSGALTNEQIQNFKLATECFSALNKDFSFSRVNASSNEILVATPSGEIYYEYLSSGFKIISSFGFIGYEQRHQLVKRV